MEDLERVYLDCNLCEFRSKYDYVFHREDSKNHYTSVELNDVPKPATTFKKVRTFLN